MGNHPTDIKSNNILRGITKQFVRRFLWCLAWEVIVAFKSFVLRQGRLILALLAVIVAAIMPCTMASAMSILKHPQNDYTGMAEIKFPPGTYLNVESASQLVILLRSFKGHWKGGRADGYGELQAVYLKPQADNPTYQQLNSANPEVRAQASALIERVREEAKFLRLDTEAAVNNLLGAREFEFSYSGEFSDGIAMGVGELISGSRRLRGTFYKWLPEGLVTHFAGNFVVMAENLVKGMPSDGPVIVNLFPSGVIDTSRRFVGMREGGKISGDWYNTQWQAAAIDYSEIGLGSIILTKHVDGVQTRCQYKAEDLVPVTSELIDRIRGQIESVPQLYDPSLIRLPESCQRVTAEGWIFRYRVSGGGPLDAKPAPPFTCADPQGREGQVSFSESDIAICNVTTIATEYRWLSRFGKELGRIGRDVKKIILWPIDQGGEKFTEVVCGVAQKEPGENCHVFVSGGTTFNIPDNKVSQAQRADESLARFLDARAKLADPAAATGRLLAGQQEMIKSIGICGSNCVGADRDISRIGIVEIQRLMKDGFDEDVKRYRLASYAGGARDFFGLYGPNALIKPPQLDKEGVYSALKEVLDNSRFKVEVDTKLQKYVGGYDAAIESIKWASDFRTILKIQNQISWATASLSGNEVGYFAVSIGSSGDVNMLRLRSANEQLYEDPAAKTVRVTIVGVMSAEALRNKLSKEYQQKADAELRQELDEKLRKAVSDFLKR